MLIYTLLEWLWVASPNYKSVGIFGVALLFTAFGIWAGLKLSGSKSAKQAKAPSVNLQDFDIRPREFEILELMAKGLSNQEIADELHISLSTVKTHNMNLYSKLDVKRRTQAVSKAVELGILAD